MDGNKRHRSDLLNERLKFDLPLLEFDDSVRLRGQVRQQHVQFGKADWETIAVGLRAQVEVFDGQTQAAYLQEASVDALMIEDWFWQFDDMTYARQLCERHMPTCDPESRLHNIDQIVCFIGKKLLLDALRHYDLQRACSWSCGLPRVSWTESDTYRFLLLQQIYLMSDVWNRPI